MELFDAKKCEHDINLNNNTITLFKRRFMVCPDIIYGKCTNCNKLVKYTKDNDIWLLKEDDHDEN